MDVRINVVNFICVRARSKPADVRPAAHSCYAIKDEAEMRSFFLSALTFVIAAGAGAFLAHSNISDGVGFSRETVDGWLASGAAGATDADPWTRAVVAKKGLMALNKNETIYFSRATDDRNDRLREECSYILTGKSLRARWWSITLYAGDYYLAQNEDGAHSIDATRVVVEQSDADAYRVLIARTADGTSNWLSTRNAGAPNLVLRMYHPDPDIRDNPSGLDLPDIERVDCLESAA